MYDAHLIVHLSSTIFKKVFMYCLIYSQNAPEEVQRIVCIIFICIFLFKFGGFSLVSLIVGWRDVAQYWSKSPPFMFRNNLKYYFAKRPKNA